MYWLCLAALAATAAAQGSYDLEPRVPYPGKSSSLGPLYSSGLSAGQGFRDNSYEDNIVTPTPSPTPAFRNPSSQPPVSNKIIIYSRYIRFCTYENYKRKILQVQISSYKKYDLSYLSPSYLL